MNKTILIVCEGESTEPVYFESIRDILIDKGIDVKITISPMPKNEKQEMFKLRNGAKRRELKKLDLLEEGKLKKYEVEDEYKAQPTRYVREAQMRLEDGSYDEAWAVFDKDGHPKQEEAFELAKNKIKGKNINIAFNSISFEHWTLIHFEENYTQFQKSQCREGEENFCCGTNTNPKDCKGNLCVHGYMINKNYIASDCKKKKFLFKELPKYNVAIENAVKLRNVKMASNPQLPIYELNPYTTIDRLVFRLINLPIDYCWVNGNEELFTKNFSFKIERKNNIIEISVKNLKPEIFILVSGLFGLINSLGEFKPVSDRILLGVETIKIEINLDEIQDFNSIYMGLKTGDNEYLFTDI